MREEEESLAEVEDMWFGGDDLEPQTEPPPPHPRVLQTCRLIPVLPPAEALNCCPAQVSSSGESKKVPSAFAPQDEQTSLLSGKSVFPTAKLAGSFPFFLL